MFTVIETPTFQKQVAKVWTEAERLERERMDRGRKGFVLRHEFGFNEKSWLTTTAYRTETYRYYDRLNQINGVNLGQVTTRINTGAADAALLQGALLRANDRVVRRGESVAQGMG